MNSIGLSTSNIRLPILLSEIQVKKELYLNKILPVKGWLKGIC